MASQRVSARPGGWDKSMSWVGENLGGNDLYDPLEKGEEGREAEADSLLQSCGGDWWTV